MNGQSLLAAMKKPESARLANERFFEYYKLAGQDNPAMGIVTNQYKYIDYVKSNDILIDLKRDPQETNNLVGRWEYEAVVKVLQKRIEQHKTSK